MDSTAVNTLLTSGSSTIDVLAPFLFAGLVIPLVAWLQKFNLVVSYQIIEVAIWLGIVALLRTIFSPELEFKSMIAYALQFLGASSLLYGGYATAKTLTKKQPHEEQMKRFLTIVTVLVLAFCISATAQVKTYGVIHAGSSVQTGGKPSFGLFVGANIPFVTDTAKHYTAYNQTGYFYSKSPDNIQSITTFVVNEKWFDIKDVTLHVGLGAGILQQIQEGGDKTMAGFGLELGVTVWKSLTLSVGAKYYPASKEPDRAFPYVGLDLLPF